MNKTKRMTINLLGAGLLLGVTAAKAAEKPAAPAAGDLTALPWTALREQFPKGQAHASERFPRALEPLIKREAEVYRQIEDGTIDEACPTVLDVWALEEMMANHTRKAGGYAYFDRRAEVLLDAAGKERMAAEWKRVAEAEKKYKEEDRQEYEAALKSAIEANPEWAAAERRLKEATAKLEALGVNDRGEPKDGSRKLTDEEKTAAAAAAKEYKEAERTNREQFYDKYFHPHGDPERLRLKQAGEGGWPQSWMLDAVRPWHNQRGVGRGFIRERHICHFKMGSMIPQFLPVVPDPDPDPALPRIDESGRKPGTAKTLDLGNGVQLELVWIPAGEFMMGSPTNEPGRYMTERLHRVKLTKGFWMGKYEFTQEQWQRVMGNNPSWFTNSGPKAPVETVRRDQAQKFLWKLNEMTAGKEGAGKFRLPTEAEWEWACRAGTTTALYSGKMTIKSGNNSPELSAIAWYAGNSGVDYEGGVLSTLWEDKEQNHHSAGTHPVGGKKPNAWGLYDMLGNVQEMCTDWFGPYPTQAVTDPTGPNAWMGEGDHILRGGSYGDGVRLCRSAARSYYNAEFSWRNATIGFRVAMDEPAAGQAAEKAK